MCYTFVEQLKLLDDNFECLRLRLEYVCDAINPHEKQFAELCNLYADLGLLQTAVSEIGYMAQFANHLPVRKKGGFRP